MIGIQKIESYIPDGRVSNYARKGQFGVDDDFIRDKIGVDHVAVMGEDEDTSELCVKAFMKLLASGDVQKDKIDLLVVVTQNPDTNIPHASALAHGKLDLPLSCACFDISLGCSGFVYGLSIVQSFMEANSFRAGVLITADPYSKIVDPKDKDTSLLFGDAASATLVSLNPQYITRGFSFGTLGRESDQLKCVDGRLHMNGRAIFNLVAKHVYTDIKHLLADQEVDLEKVNRFIFHQGSKFVVETLARRLGVDEDRAVFGINDYGNTVSSSIPIILQDEMEREGNRLMVLSGFGVGLSWASAILERVTEV